MSLPFEIQNIDLSDEDYAALSEYYSQPYYARDASLVAHVKQYPAVQESKPYKQELRDMDGCSCKNTNVQEQ